MYIVNYIIEKSVIELTKFNSFKKIYFIKLSKSKFLNLARYFNLLIERYFNNSKNKKSLKEIKTILFNQIKLYSTQKIFLLY